MIVSLPLTAQEFTLDLQDKFKAGVAAAADVELYRVSIDSVTDTSMFANPLEIKFSIRVPKDSPGMSPA